MPDRPFGGLPAPRPVRYWGVNDWLTAFRAADA